MSDMKRVPLTTLSTSLSSTATMAAYNTSGSTATSSRFGSDFLTGQQNPTDRLTVAGPTNAADRMKSNKSIRLNIELFQTDSCKYPEFNYSRLMHLEKKKLKKLKQKSNGYTNPFNDNDDDVARIARELEKKYGSSYGSGRGRSKKDDLCDIGMGYDESDSFIDNTEAYDEIIPEELETIEGGFYINCGPLEFQKLHTESTTTKTDEIIKMPNRPRKRVISSSSSESSSNSEEEDADEDGDSDGEASSADTIKGSKNTSVIITQPSEKRPRTNSTVNPTKKPKPSQESRTNKKGQIAKNTVVGGSSTSNSPKPSSVGSDSEKERVRQKVVKTTTIKDMLKAKRDNFLKMQEGTSSGNGTNGNSDVKVINGELKGTSSKSSDDDSSSSDESDESSDESDSNDELEEKKTKNITAERTEKLRTSDTKLPEIEAVTLADVQQFKEIVKLKNMTGKRFQFDDSLAEMFLKIDEALLCVEKTHRNMVFAHLEYHLLLPKYFFLRKAKQLRIKEEKIKSKRALGKLRKAVIEAMPSVIANFEAEIRKHADLAINVNVDHPPKMPKKKFPWNNNLRNLLYDVYQVRWTSFPVLGTRKETLEDFINVFLREKVVELWPKDWMRLEELQREIEKRKSVAKKAKEKKKEKDKNSSNANSINATTANATVSSASGTFSQSVCTTATTTTTTTNTYMKQFEEFATGSRSSFANSDTESVASSGTSNGLKRKNSGKGAAKVAKIQPQLSNMPHCNSTMEGNNKSQQLPTFLPASANMDFGMRPGLTSNATAASSVPSQVSNMMAQPPVLSATSQSKHSKLVEKNVQVIDLDNYRSSNDVPLMSQQMVRSDPSGIGATNSATATSMSNPKTALNAPGVPNRRESSSESDGVEFVRVYPATQSKPALATTSKQKYKKNSSLNYAMDTVNIKSIQSGSSSITTKNNNNNNINASNNNSQNVKVKQLESINSVPNYDNKQTSRTAKDLGELQQQKISQNGAQ